MAGRIPDEMIREVQERADIVEIISEFVNLKKTGKTYKALCPFHQEKTPSFHVVPEKQIFYCFGCRSGGSVFRFLMKHEGMTFNEALRSVAERVGVKVESRSFKDDSRTLPLIEANEFAAAYFHKILISGGQGRKAADYLEGRGVSREAIEAFRLGYAPASWEGFIADSGRKGIAAEVLEKAGLVQARTEGGFIGRFRQRVTFPIFNVSGKVVAFGGRTLGVGEPKYLNSPETPIYRKGEMLYGIHLAKEEMRRTGRAVLVEGYLDLVRMWQEQFRNAVATLGTALTADQGRLARRYAREAVVLFDPDEAGRDAALRGLDVLVGVGLRVKVVSLPGPGDPDEFLKSNGRHGLETLLARADGLIEYKLAKLSESYDRRTLAGRISIMDEMLPTLAAIVAPGEGIEARTHLAEKLGVSDHAVTVALDRFRKGGSRLSGSESPKAEVASIPVERALLQLLLENTELVPVVSQELTAGDFTTPEHKRIAELLLGEGAEGATDVINRLREEEPSDLVAMLAAEAGQHEDPNRVARDCIERIKMRRRKMERMRVARCIEEAERQGERERVPELLREHQSWW